MSAMVGDWLYAIGSNMVFSPVLIAALSLLTVVLVILIFLLAFDLYRQRQDRRRKALRQAWFPFLFAAMTETTAPSADQLPRLKRRDIYQFIMLWNTLYDTVRGGSLSYQRTLADRLKLLPTVRRWIRGPRIDHRLAAMICFGNLREHAAWSSLVKRIDASNTVESLTAARALVQIDALGAMPLIWQRLERRDWSTSRVTALISHVPASTLRFSLPDYVEHLPVEALYKLLRIGEGLLHGQLDDVMHRALERLPNDNELKALVCNCADDPRWLPLIRSSLQAPHPGLRVAAVKALGRIGESDDRSTLISTLVDSHWWVRYRGAQSLSCLPGVTVEHLQRLAAHHPSGNARAILAHVLAEGTA